MRRGWRRTSSGRGGEPWVWRRSTQGGRATLPASRVRETIPTRFRNAAPDRGGRACSRPPGAEPALSRKSLSPAAGIALRLGDPRCNSVGAPRAKVPLSDPKADIA